MREITARHTQGAPHGGSPTSLQEHRHSSVGSRVDSLEVMLCFVIFCALSYKYSISKKENIFINHVKHGTGTGTSLPSTVNQFQRNVDALVNR